jgi:hypothetical protein
VVGVSQKTVHRAWQAHGLKPHRPDLPTQSRSQFVEKLTDVVGLYLNPPDKALVFCADEKSQIQALDRTQPGLPLKKGRGATMTHDSKRHGTTTLFAALNVLTSKLIGTCQRRHRHQEWLRFLTLLDQHTLPTPENQYFRFFSIKPVLQTDMLPFFNVVRSSTNG